MDTLELKCLKTSFGDIPVYTQPMKVKDVVFIHYVARRGIDKEEGAVQRVLNKRRIDSIKNFVLDGNMFFNTFILNWTDEHDKPVYNERKCSISIPIRPEAAQVIDGQHRLAGLEAARTVDSSIEGKEILVSICIGLSTKQAATIFLNINSEQKPVPKSLIYDLFGEVEANKDHAINRARDIAIELHESKESPYYNAIKFPGMARGVAAIDLSTVISSLKRHLEPGGIFSQYNLTSLERQKQVILNYFLAIKSFYDKEGIWQQSKKNPFLRSAGFNGAIDYLTSKLLMECANKKSFTVETFKSFLALDNANLLLQEEVKDLGGTAAAKEIRHYLESNLSQSLPKQDEYQF